MNFFPFVSIDSPYSNTKIPYTKGPFVLSVDDYFIAMSFNMHVSSKLKDLNYDSFCIEIVPCIPPTFNGDVLFELPPPVSPNSHYGQMQGMDKKHDGHVWYKVKMTNIKNNFNLNFQRASYLGHLQYRNDAYDFLLLNKCRNEIVWSGNVVHKF
jgi:hypothetical protein